MPKLPRTTQQIFCGNNTNNQIAQFGSMQTGKPVYTTDLNTLQSNEAYTTGGWKSAVLANYAPFLEEDNSLHYITTSQLAYLFQQGIPEWDPNTTYYLNSFCQYEGLIYQSLVDENIGLQPDNNTNEWKLFSTANNISNPFFLGMSFYFETQPNNASWLRSTGQDNSKNIYPNMYNWILENVNQGTKDFKSSMSYAFNGSINCWFPVRNPVVGAWAYSTTNGAPIGQVETINENGSLVVNGTTVTFTGGGQAGTSLFTDYDFIINETQETFRLPLLNGDEFLQSNSDFINDVMKNSNTWNVPCNGYIVYSANSNAADSSFGFAINNKDVYHQTENYTNQQAITRQFVKRGDIVAATLYRNVYLSSIFYKATGNGALYYYVGETVENANLIDAGSILEQLSTKVNIQTATTAGMPSSKYTDLVAGASGTTYTAVADGYVQAGIGNITAANTSWVALENTTTGYKGSTVFGPWGYANTYSIIFVNKGDKFTLTYNSTVTSIGYFRFTYAQGAQE